MRKKRVSPVVTQLRTPLQQAQAKLAALEREASQMRNVLFAIVKEQGRIRISKKTIQGLQQDDRIDARDVGEDLVITFVESQMVLPGGTSGKAGA